MYCHLNVKKSVFSSSLNQFINFSPPFLLQEQNNMERQLFEFMVATNSLTSAPFLVLHSWIKYTTLTPGGSTLPLTHSSDMVAGFGGATVPPKPPSARWVRSSSLRRLLHTCHSATVSPLLSFSFSPSRSFFSFSPPLYQLILSPKTRQCPRQGDRKAVPTLSANKLTGGGNPLQRGGSCDAFRDRA